MSDEMIRVLTRLADEFETIGERGFDEAEPTKTLPRAFVVAHIRAIGVSYQLAQEAVEAVKRMEEKS